MKALVTGGCGFIGRALVERLAGSGHDVMAADLKTDTSGKHPATCVDVLDLEQLGAAIAGTNVVYHLAGPVLDTARRDPFWSSKLQLLGTLNVLEACRRSSVPKVVLASSFYVYDGLPPQGIVNESSPLDPSRMELFGSLKVAAEQLVLGYARRFGLKFVILRFGSAYGWGEGSNLVQTFFEAGLQGHVLEVWGGGTRANQYTYIQDIAAGAVQALSLENEIVNLISPEETSTSELAALMSDKFGFTMKLLVDKPEGADFPYMSCRKALRLLDWKPTPLTEALDALGRQIQQSHKLELVGT
jgi:UDP-glucose 4-epimerase